jgi:DnaJ family protein C protein 8
MSALLCIRAIRIQHAAEGEAERKREEATAERKRKLEESDKWENTRDDRINGE